MTTASDSIPTAAEALTHWGYIYRITNTVTGRVYIGIHASKPSETWDGYQGSGTYLKQEQNSYGPESFTKDFVEWVESEPEAVTVEAKHISAALRSGPCYNSNNAYSVEAVAPDALFHSFAFKASFRPTRRLNSLVKSLVRQQRDADSLEEKHRLQRSIEAHLLALNLKRLRQATTQRKDRKP